jgi:hypothetical protein
MTFVASSSLQALPLTGTLRSPEVKVSGGSVIRGTAEICDTLRILKTYDTYKKSGRPARLFVRIATDSGSCGRATCLAIRDISKRSLVCNSIVSKLKRRFEIPLSVYFPGEFDPVIHLEGSLSDITNIVNLDLLKGALSGIQTLVASLNKKPKKWGDECVRLNVLAVRLQAQIDQISRVKIA